MKINRVVILILVIIFSNPLFSSLSAQPIGPPGAFDRVAMSSGDWNNPMIWEEGAIPQSGDIVHIPSNITVTIRRQEAARIKFIQIGYRQRLPLYRQYWQR